MNAYERDIAKIKEYASKLGTKVDIDYIFCRGYPFIKRERLRLRRAWNIKDPTDLLQEYEERAAVTLDRLIEEEAHLLRIQRRIHCKNSFEPGSESDSDSDSECIPLNWEPVSKQKYVRQHFTCGCSSYIKFLPKDAKFVGCRNCKKSRYK